MHSPHPNRAYGPNPFAGNPHYDPHITEVLRDVAKQHHLSSEDVDLVELMHDLKVLLRAVRVRNANSCAAAKRA